MKQVLFTLCIIGLLCPLAISQTPKKTSQRRETGPAAQTTPPTPRQTSEGAAQGAADQATGEAVVPEDFVIGPEDVLEITVWREAELATKAVVRPDGKIGVPLLGDVQASGLTTTRLRENLAAQLTRFVAEPVVSVVVVEMHSQMVHLIGAVGRPGAYTLGGPLTIVELLARAGGLGESARAQEIAIVRSNGHGQFERIPFNYKAFAEGKALKSNIQLKNGDVIVVR